MTKIAHNLLSYEVTGQLPNEPTKFTQQNS